MPHAPCHKQFARREQGDTVENMQLLIYRETQPVCRLLSVPHQSCSSSPPTAHPPTWQTQSCCRIRLHFAGIWATRSWQRRWCSGKHGCVPNSRSGFDSRPAQGAAECSSQRQNECGRERETVGEHFRFFFFFNHKHLTEL